VLSSLLRGAFIGWGFVRLFLLLVPSLLYGLLAKAYSRVLLFLAPRLFATRLVASSFASSALCLAVEAFFVTCSLCPLHDLGFLGGLGFSVLGLVFFAYPFDPDPRYWRCVQASLRSASYGQFNDLFCLFGPGFMWGARHTGILTSGSNQLMRLFAIMLKFGKGQSLPRACGNLAFERVARSLTVGLLLVGSIGYASLSALYATSIASVTIQGDSPRIIAPRPYLLADATVVLPTGGTVAHASDIRNALSILDEGDSQSKVELFVVGQCHMISRHSWMTLLTFVMRTLLS
jgi:hypothetical protein